MAISDFTMCQPNLADDLLKLAREVQEA